jgi:predicted Rossmann fold flavoprotein
VDNSANKKIIYDLAVIGGGPAGMMAAGRAAELGARVLLLEKNDKLGKKLLITGGGRCNITNAEFDIRALLARYRAAEPFLFSTFAQFGVEETLDFFRGHQLETKVEAEKRAFPIANKAESVWQVLVDYLKAGKVIVRSEAEVVGLSAKGQQITGVKLKGGEEIVARSYVLATGGLSRPDTGSTGEGFKWLEGLGHNIVKPKAALVPLKTAELWSHRLAGTALPKAKVAVYQNGSKQFSREGKILFTHVGLSGPLILNMSHEIDELLKYGPVELSLDLLAGQGYDQVDQLLLTTFADNSNKKFKNSLGKLLPSALAPVVVELSGIEGEKAVNEIKREERLKLGKLLKDLRLTVTGLLGLEKAVVTSGGVALEEVDFKTMRSKLYPNLHLVGDVLNIDRPSGGFSLQLCWTTGYVAGSNATVDIK